MHVVEVDEVTAETLPESVTSVVGVPKEGVDRWSINKRTRPGGPLKRLEHSDGNGAIVQRWPLSDLSLETIRERWGDDGEYRVNWFIGSESAGGGFLFRLEPLESATATRARVEAPAPAAPVSRVPSQLAETFEIMGILQQQNAAQLRSTLEVAAAMSRGSGGGLDATTLLTILDRAEARTERLITAMSAQHAEQMQALRAAIADDGGDDEGEEDAPSVVGRVAEVAEPFIRKNQDIKSALVNHLAKKPEDLFEFFKAVKSIPEAMAHLASMQAQQAAAPTPVVTPPPSMSAPSAEVRTRPRVNIEPPLPGINELARRPAETEPAPAPVTNAASATEAAAE